MPTFGTPSYGGTGSGTTLTIPKPADLANGDILLIAARSQEGISATDWTVPAGFQRLSAAPASLPNNGARVGGIWWKSIADAGAEPASYVLTGPNGRNAGIAIRYVADVPGALNIVGTVQYGGSSAASGIVTFNGRSLTDAPAVSLIMLAAECTAGISHVPSQIPSGYTTIGNTQSTLDSSTAGSRTAIWLGWRAEPDTTVETVSGGFSGASASGGWETSIRGGLNVVVPIGVPIKLGDGSTAYLSYLDGAGVRKAPASLRMTQPAFLVADSLAKPGVTMGHRGASGVSGQPEMSRRAYRYAATKRSYRLLEFSCGRTSDGVFFGLHDRTLARTSQNAALTTAVSAMTWAEVQAYLNSLNSGGTPVPYYRLEDFLDEFGAEATVHVDPKYALGSGNTSAFLSVLAAHGGPEKIVVKYVGTGSGATALADAARGAGFLTAGYFYQTDWAEGLIAAEQSHWDILGMEYTASADCWSRSTPGAHPGLRSYGKPVLAHILPNQAAYVTAQGKIAEGGWLDGSPGHTWIAQVSGVDLVSPVW